MKKNLIVLGAMLAATFTLTNCTEELQTVTPTEKTPFTLIANVAETKTVNDGLNTKWVEGDAITVFHAAAGSNDYGTSTKFVVKDLTTGKFDAETLNGELAETNDWYVLYPYISQVETPANKAKGWTPVGSKHNVAQTQTGNDSMAHIAGSNYPMCGVAKGVEGTAMPDITMSHITSLVEVVVTNAADEPLTVTSVSFTATEDVVGTYFIDFSSETPGFTGSGATYVSNVANLNVTDGEAIAKNGTAKFYLAVKPFTAPAGEKLDLVVNGVKKSFNLTSNVTFAPGKIKTLNFTFDKAAEPMKPLSGDYVVVATNGSGKYYAMSSNTDGSRLAYVTLESFDPEADSFASADANLKWTIAANGEKYTLKNIGNSKYLSYTSGNAASTNTTEYFFTIGQEADGRYRISTRLEAETEDRILAKNADDKYGFAFYKASGNGYKDLYLMHVVDDVRKQLATPQNVTATVVAGIPNSVTVTWSAVENATTYEVTCGEETKRTSDLTCTFENLNFNTNYSISVIAKDETSAYISSDEGVTTVTTGADVTAITYVLVTNVSSLSAGDEIVIVCPSKGMAMGRQNGNYRDKVEIVMNDNKFDSVEGMAVLTLENGVSTDSFALKASDGYLYWDSGNYVKTKNTETVDNTNSWTISIAEDGTATILHVGTPARKLQYNANSPRFACYTGSQTAVSIFKPATR